MKVKNSTHLKHLAGHATKKLIVPSKLSSSQHKIAHAVHHKVNSSTSMPIKKIRTVKKIKTTKLVNKTVAAHRTTIKPVSLNSTTLDGAGHKHKKVLRVVKRKKKQRILSPTNATSINPAAVVHKQQPHPVQHNPMHQIAHKSITGGTHQRVIPNQHKTAVAAATSSVTSSTSVTSTSTSSASVASAAVAPTPQPMTTTTTTSTSTSASASTQTSSAPSVVPADSRNSYLLLTPGNNTDQSATLSVSHGVSFMPTPATVANSSNLGQMIHNKADASGLVSMSGNKILDTNHPQVVRNLTDLKPPAPISNEVIQWLSRQRIKSNEQNLELLKDVDSQRQELVSQRQANAARQMKIAGRVSGALMRESLDNNLTDRLFQSEQRRYESLRNRFSGRTRLNERAEQLQRAFSGWRR